MSTWTITDKVNGKEVGTVENKLRPLGSMMTANGAFGSYKIEGEVGTHSYTITKDGQKVSTRMNDSRTHVYTWGVCCLFRSPPLERRS